MLKHSIFKSRKIKIEMILKPCQIKLCIMKYYYLFLEELLHISFTLFINTICRDICSLLLSIVFIWNRKSNHISISWRQCTCFTVKCYFLSIRFYCSSKEHICFWCIFYSNFKLFRYILNFQISRYIIFYIIYCFLKGFFCFWSKCYHSRINYR